MAQQKSPIPPFIAKLYELTNEFVGDECFAWNEDGSQFWVTNIEIFTHDVLPAYFKHNNYASFIRQLNIYGFRRSTEHIGPGRSGPSVEIFRHPMFIRGRKDLLANIVRKTASTTSASTPLPSAVTAAGNKKMKIEDDSSDFSKYSTYAPAHGFNDVAHLHSRLHQMEAQVAYLLEQNHMLYQQQQRQEQVMDALVKMMSQVGMVSPDTTTATQSLFHVQVPIEQSPPEINLDLFDIMSSPDDMLLLRRMDRRDSFDRVFNTEPSMMMVDDGAGF